MKTNFDVDKVLVVDDDPDILSAIVRRIEEDLHLECVSAEDGEKALNKFSEYCPALVVLDVMLPKRSGFLVMERILRTPGRNSNPQGLPLVIMITGNQSRRHQVYAERIGAWRYLYKPFRLKALLDLLREARDNVDKIIKTR